MTPAQERLLTEAKLTMLRRMPYYGMFVIGMPLNEDKNIPTAATDYTQIKFNPDWLLGGGPDGRPARPRDEVVFILGHEVLHISFKHGIRMGFRNPQLWNVAADYAINQILHDGEVGKMPEPNPKFDGPDAVKLLDPKFKDMTAEAIYDLLEKQRQKNGGGQGKQRLNGVIVNLDKSDPGGMGGFEAPKNENGEAPSEQELQQMERDIDAKTSTAAALAKQMGKLPAGLEIFIKTALKPRVDWRDRLRQFVAKVFPSDASWSRPHRRYLGSLDLYLPHIMKEGVGEIGFAFDTSGSVDYGDPKSEGAQYFSECKAIFQDVSPEKMHLFYIDAAVHGHEVFEPGDDPEMASVKPKGGGGTDFRPLFTKIEKENIQLQCLVFATDGHAMFPTSAPTSYPVLWVCTTSAPIPWGQVIRMEL